MKKAIVAVALAFLTVSGAAARADVLNAGEAGPYVADRGPTARASHQLAAADLEQRDEGSIIVECHPRRIPSGLFIPKGAAAVSAAVRSDLDATGSSGSQFCWIGGSGQVPTQ